MHEPTSDLKTCPAKLCPSTAWQSLASSVPAWIGLFHWGTTVPHGTRGFLRPLATQASSGFCDPVVREGEVVRGSVGCSQQGGSRASIAVSSRRQRAVEKSHLAEFVSGIHSSGRHPRDFIKCNCPTAPFTCTHLQDSLE